MKNLLNLAVFLVVVKLGHPTATSSFRDETLDETELLT